MLCFSQPWKHVNTCATRTYHYPADHRGLCPPVSLLHLVHVYRHVYHRSENCSRVGCCCRRCLHLVIGHLDDHISPPVSPSCPHHGCLCQNCGYCDLCKIGNGQSVKVNSVYKLLHTMSAEQPCSMTHPFLKLFAPPPSK